MEHRPAHKQTLLSMASGWNDMDLLSGLMASRPEVSGANRASGFLSMAAAWLMAPLVLLAVLFSSAFSWLNHSGAPRYALASTVLLIGLASGVMFLSPWSDSQLMDTRYATMIGEQATHPLNDGSVLRLNTHSLVDVVYTENRRRLTLLQGEVHFDVASDKSRPFEVYAGNRLVRAVGTAFSVRLHSDRVKVMVSEGVVDLAVVKANMPSALVTVDSSGQLSDQSNRQLAKPASIQLTQTDAATEVFGSLKAGQSIEIPVDIKDVMNQVEYHDPQALNRHLAWIEGKLVFDGEPLEQVVREVSRYTPVKIEVTDARLKQLRIGGQFQIGETEA